MDINKLSGWGISQQIAQIIEEGFSYDEESGEVFFTTDDLENLNMALEKKIGELSGVYQMYASEAEALKNRAKDVDKNAKVLANKAERIKRYIDSLMQANHKDSMKVGDKTISYRKSVASLITDTDALMAYINSNDELKEKYLVYKEPEISKKAIADDIKATKQQDGTYTLVIPGFTLVENKNISIK